MLRYSGRLILQGANARLLHEIRKRLGWGFLFRHIHIRPPRLALEGLRLISMFFAVLAPTMPLPTISILCAHNRRLVVALRFALRPEKLIEVLRPTRGIPSGRLRREARRYREWQSM
jgi:hypothetical protein